MVGLMMVAALFVMLLFDLQTLCAITNRRALTVRTAWGKRTVTATRFRDMDKTFEISDIGRGAGHLNFASGRSTALRIRITPAATGSAAFETLPGCETFWSARDAEPLEASRQESHTGRAADHGTGKLHAPATKRHASRHKDGSALRPFMDGTQI
jgi:hypothetical protein